MRTAFIEELCDVAARDERVWLLCGDLGYSVLEVFAQRFPQRYVNVGVAEQNMTAVAAGLAMTGKVVFTYSIGNFPVFRCLEQIRTDVCYHNLNVKVVSVGGGLAYGTQGYTHHAVEDLAVMSALPNMTVIAPGDPIETKAAVSALVAEPGPGYLRLGKAGEPRLHNGRIDFAIGKAITMMNGSDVTLVSTGGMLGSVLEAAAKLRKNGISVRVLSMHTVRPLDREAIRSAIQETQGVITVEEHSWGGLGTQVAEEIATSGMQTRFVPVRLPNQPAKCAGSQEYLRTAAGLSVDDICRHAVKVVEAAVVLPVSAG